MPRRERWTILGAILEAVEQESARGERPRATRVAAHANLPFDRLQGFYSELETAGLLMVDGDRRLTEKGRAFLAEYRRWRRVLDAFGLDEP